MNWVEILIGLFTGGGIVALFTIPQAIKKAKAETKAAEMENVQRASDAWKDLAEERQEAYNELRTEYKDAMTAKNAKIDELYKDITDWRDKYNHSQEELSQERVWRAANEVKLCIIRGCEKRDPPSGY